MGTNYYARFNACDHCGRSDELHIGKSSSGWCFALHVEPDFEPPLNDWPDWEALLSADGAVIHDEGGKLLTLDELRRVVTSRVGRGRGPVPAGFLRENHAVRGPAGLVRCTVDGRHCVGHGSGTWDLIVGEFS